MARSLNRFELIGRLTKDPEVRFTTSGKQVTSFTVAVDDDYRNAEGELVDRTQFVRCQAWNGLGETISKFQHKGRRVYVAGKISLSRNGEGDNAHYFTDFVAQDVIFLDAPKTDGLAEEPEPAGESIPF